MEEGCYLPRPHGLQKAELGFEGLADRELRGIREGDLGGLCGWKSNAPHFCTKLDIVSSLRCPAWEVPEVGSDGDT